MIYLQLTANTRAAGVPVTAGEVLSEATHDLRVLRAINAAGKGEWVKGVAEAPTPAPVEPEPIADEDTDSEPEQAAPKRRGRKPKES